MQREYADTQGHGGTISDDAAKHSPKCAGSVGFRPEQAENHNPEKGRFQTAESKHIDFPDDRRRGDGNQIDARTKKSGSGHAETLDPPVAQSLAVLFQRLHIHVFNDGRRSGQ